MAAIASLSTPALAGPKYAIYPVQTGDETARFRQGVPTLDLETPTGAVQLTPLPMDHGSLSFAVAVYNKGATTANFGVENVAVQSGPQTLAVFTKDQLVAKAKNRAMWTAIAVGVLAAGTAAAVANASTTQTYHSQTYTPWGRITHVASYTDNTLGTVAAGASVGAGVAGIVGIQNRLDYTIANLNDEIVQLTTVDPDASYGGRIVIEKLKAKALPVDVRLNVSWNGASYPFTFRVAKPGKDMPPPYVARAVIAPAPVAPPSATVAPVAAVTSLSTPVSPSGRIIPAVLTTPSIAPPISR